MSGARTRAVLLLAWAAVPLLPAAVAAEPLSGGIAPPGRSAAGTGIRLLAPVHGVDPLADVNLGLRPDRLKKSVVPGPVRDTEHVTAALGASGAPIAVTDEQRLDIHGAGGYVIRELGPARAAQSLGNTVPPVLELGTVVWQGFSPGRRTLAARLTLDPGIEAARLPMTVSMSFRGTDGRPATLRPGAAAPVDGTVSVTLTNNTTTQRIVDVGRADPAAMAGVLDRLLRAAGHPRAAVPPVAGSGLPTVVPGHRTGQTQISVTAPLGVTGSITAAGGPAAIAGPGLTATADGAQVAGTLDSTATFTVRLRRGQRLGLDLDVRPWLDPRAITPPAPASSWRAWAAAGPAPQQVSAATATLTSAAAAAARSAEYSPYLQADAPGPDLSTFTYIVAAPPAARRAEIAMDPRPGGITAAVVAFLAIVGDAALLRRLL